MKALQISNRGKQIPISPMRGLMPFADEATRKGTKVYRLSIGNPDFPIHPVIKNSLQRIADTIETLPYPPSRGLPQLLSSWKKYFSDINIPIEIEDKDIVVTAGAGEAISSCALAILDPNDEYILFEPFYPTYLAAGTLAGAKPISVQLDKTNGYHLPPKEEIVKKITTKTKAIFLTNPSNPTGTVYAKEEIETVLRISQEYGLFIICDEAYRGLVFDNKESMSILHLASSIQLPNIIVIDSLSKRLNACGARMGLIFSKNQELIQSVFRIIESQPTAALIEQEIVKELLSDSLPYRDELKGEYEKRRNAFISTFESEMHAKITKPEGAFYLMLQLPINNDVDFAKWLLTDFSENGETVMVAPGSGFYLNSEKGRNEVRIAYVLNESDMEKAAKILAHGVIIYNQQKK